MVATSTYTFRDLFSAAKYLLPRQTLLMRGRHGIGKSEAAYQLAEVWGLKKVIERRVAQLSEGDILGLPDRGAVKVNETTNEAHAVTKFLPTDWFLEAMFEPCLLFMDEINRGTLEVQQACFQLVEKGELNGRRVHPETRIVAAINNSREYQVSPMDPAFQSRFWVADIEPDKQDWLAWARSPRGHINGDIIDFIAQCNEDHFEVKPEKMGNPNDVLPSRRSWARLNNHLTFVHPGLRPLVDEPNNPAFYPLCKGFIGPDATRALMLFFNNRNTNVSPEDVLLHFNKNKARILKLSTESMSALIDKVAAHVKARKGLIEEEEGKNISRFIQSIPKEMGVALWNHLSRSGVENATVLHRYTGRFFMELLAQTKVGDILPHLGKIAEAKPPEGK